MADQPAWKRKRPRDTLRYVLLGSVLAFGVILILAAGYLENQYWRSAVEHLGTAAFIAALLGLTFHIWVGKQLTEDVLSAAMGYELPPELREEIRHVYGSRIICEEHIQTVTIENLPGEEFVQVTVGIERTLRNIGQADEDVPITFRINDWGIQGHPSKVIELAYRFEDRATVTLFPDGTAKQKYRPQGPAIEGDALKLGSKEAVTIYTKHSEVKAQNAEHQFHFQYSTLNPRVTVRVPEGFGWTVGFDHRSEPKRGQYSDTFVLNGLLLPHQNIRVRWWPGLGGDLDGPPGRAGHVDN
jgi:hypothetical protein